MCKYIKIFISIRSNYLDNKNDFPFRFHNSKDVKEGSGNKYRLIILFSSIRRDYQNILS